MDSPIHGGVFVMSRRFTTRETGMDLLYYAAILACRERLPSRPSFILCSTCSFSVKRSRRLATFLLAFIHSIPGVSVYHVLIATGLFRRCDFFQSTSSATASNFPILMNFIGFRIFFKAVKEVSEFPTNRDARAYNR